MCVVRARLISVDPKSPHPKSLSLMERDFQEFSCSPFAMREKGVGGMRVINTAPLRDLLQNSQKFTGYF